ncbi:MAG: hypothetical protein FJ087_18080 [Deltaproteobacteria bacterium]|nr:hypothetical protein [Deltaproteobacteria bacterium]
MLARLVVPGLVLALACGGGSSAGKRDDAAAPGDLPPADAADAIGGGEEGADGPAIDTAVSTESAKTGDSVTVTCSGTGLDAGLAKFVVHEAIETPPEDGGPDAGPPTSADVTEPPEAQYPPDQTLPEGVTVSGNQVKFTRPGLYAIACYSDEAQIVDSTPASVDVEPAQAIDIQTVVSPAALKAGEWVNVTCSARDAFGNPVDATFGVHVAPAEGVTTSGLTAQLTRVGSYTVACTMQEGGLTDLTPEKVDVSPNVPKKVLTFADPPIVAAGDPSEISCTATDYWDNPVENFPVSLVVPLKMKLKGKSVSSTVTGVYPVKCVPQNLDWKYFTIVPADVTVTAGAPVSMTLTVEPQKGCYGVGEKITVKVVAKDKYDNLVPDAQLAVPEIDALSGNPTGIVPNPADPNGSFILKEEGHYLLTFRLLGAPQVYTEFSVCVEGSGPLLTILYPPRGATIKGKPSVTIMGQMNDPQSGVQAARLKFNGSEFDMQYNIKPDGSFSYLVSLPQGLRQGLNVFTIEVENGNGAKASTTQGFYFSYAWYMPIPGDPKGTGYVFNAIRAMLGQQFFDDGVHDPSHPDDVATILETFFSNLNIGALIPSPAATFSPYKIYISNVHYGKAALQLHLYDGGIQLLATLPNLGLNIDAKAKCKFLFFDVCPDVSGSLHVDNIVVNGQLDLWFEKAADPKQDGKVHAKLKDIQVNVQGIDIEIDGILGWLLGGLINWAANQFAGTIETMIEQQVGGMVDKTLEDLFSKFNITQTIEIPAVLPGMQPSSLTIFARPYELNLEPQGVYLGLDGTFYTTKAVTHDVLGSIAHTNCLDMTPGPKFDLPAKSEIEFAIFDDLLNEALFAIWWGGTLNLTLGQEVLGDVDLSQYGVTDLAVKLDFYLPPILTDCNPDHELQAQIGDLHADVDIVFGGMPLKISAFVEAALAAEIFLTDNPTTGQKEVGAKLLGLRTLEIDIVGIQMCNDLGVCEDKTDMKDLLLQLLKDQLVTQLEPQITNKVLASFAIPAIDLATLVPGLPAAVELKLALEELWRATYTGTDNKPRSFAFTAAGGHLE